MSSGTSVSSRSDRRYPRDSAEFDRVLAFSDGLFAIAMTLLVIGIEVPSLPDEASSRDMIEALEDLYPAVISYVISFAVIGRYWLAHHRFVSRLKEMDGRFIALNLVYLGVVAFFPFPTALIGELSENPISVVVYALTAAALSGMEVVLMRQAHFRGLMDLELTPSGIRWASIASLSPVVFFLLSIPVAFVHTGLAVCFWFLAIPAGIAMGRVIDDDTEAEIQQLG